MDLTPKHYADFLDIGLLLGLCTRAEVEHWAERLIAASDRPPDWALELAVCTHKHPLDVCHTLRAVPGAANPEQSLRLLLAKLAIAQPALKPDGDIHPADWQLASGLYRVICDRGNLSENVRGPIADFYLDISCILGGSGDRAILERSYAALLAAGRELVPYLEAIASCSQSGDRA
ncbi:hypothetical protein KR51_00026680 [Rubidibacter lacunae KORDI 51-2]|uniref:Uncharacterized protein n=1 Tax=Rubidibacter lacunae KORDI 51-2 TaxID=582515 RepID=U5D7U1_9CHRO|nr:hypothetical protein [Rubidibacter lacunae]ERN40683.1 hypothetical protein KR51_00026680 [Rubidibacter lacunae KORDI 51-2]